MSIEEQIQGILENAAESIKRNLADKGINATGRTSRSIKVKKIASGFQLGKFPEGEETAPLQTLEIGRPGGKVPKNFKYIIWDWMEAKGIATGDPKEDAKIAGAIAYGTTGIKRLGTKRHKEKSEDVFSTVVKTAADEIENNLNTLLRNEITEMIKTNF